MFNGTVAPGRPARGDLEKWLAARRDNADADADVAAAIASWARPQCGNWDREKNFSFWHDDANPATMSIRFTATRDSGLMEQSNAAAIESILSDYWQLGAISDGDNAEPITCGHWAVGHVDGYLIRMFDDGVPTIAAGIMALIDDRLAECPVLDDGDYIRREEIALRDAVRDIIRQVSGAPVADDATVTDVVRWLYDNAPDEMENRDDTGAYPSEGAVMAALIATWHVANDMHWKGIMQ